MITCIGDCISTSALILLNDLGIIAEGYVASTLNPTFIDMEMKISRL